MFNSKPDGTESGDFIVDQDFRQVGLLKNPKVDSDTGTAFTASTVTDLRNLSSLHHLLYLQKTIRLLVEHHKQLES